MIKQANLSHEDMELLSAYIDGAVQEKEKIHFEFRLQESADLRQALEFHKQLQWNLRHLPKPKLPHNFTLTRVEAQAVKRQKAWIPVFSTASFVSFLMMAVMFILPIFSPAASPAPQNMVTHAPLSSTSSPSTEDALKAQAVPEVAPPTDSEPTESLPAPMAATARSVEEDTAPLLFSFGQAMGKGGGGGGDGSLDSGGGGGGGVDAYLYPVAQGPGNMGIFGNAPYGIIIPVEPLFGSQPGAQRAQDYNLEQALAATPSLPPLILGMNLENAGQLIASEPTFPNGIEPMGAAFAPEVPENLSATAEVPLRSREPGLDAETPTSDTQVPTRTAQSSNFINALKIAAGALTLLFAGLALYYKKR